MKILSLNTWDGKLADEVSTFIQRMAADVDVFCFQEATEPMKDIYKPLLPEYTEFCKYKFVTETDTFNQTILIRRNIAVLDSGSVLENTPKVGLDLWVKLAFEGSELFVCNYHGNAQPGSKLDTPQRLLASQALIDFFNQKEQPRVIIGDFNLLNTVKSVAVFEENGYVDLIKKYQITNTRNRYVWEQYPQSIQYYADFAFVSDDIKEKDFVVFPDEVSDHAPLLLEL